MLIANQIVSAAKIERLVGLARQASVAVAFDSAANAEDVSREAVKRGATVGAVIEKFDTGMNRGRRTAGSGRRLRPGPKR